MWWSDVFIHNSGAQSLFSFLAFPVILSCNLTDSVGACLLSAHSFRWKELWQKNSTSRETTPINTKITVGNLKFSIQPFSTIMTYPQSIRSKYAKMCSLVYVSCFLPNGFIFDNHDDDLQNATANEKISQRSNCAQHSYPICDWLEPSLTRSWASAMPASFSCWISLLRNWILCGTKSFSCDNFMFILRIASSNV